MNCIRVQFDSALCAAASPCNSKGILLAWGTHSTTFVGFHLWGIYFPTRNGSVWVIDSWLRGAIAPLLEWSASQRGCCFLCPPTLSRLLFGHSCHMFTVTCVTYIVFRHCHGGTHSATLVGFPLWEYLFPNGGCRSGYRFVRGAIASLSGRCRKEGFPLHT